MIPGAGEAHDPAAHPERTQGMMLGRARQVEAEEGAEALSRQAVAFEAELVQGQSRSAAARARTDASDLRHPMNLRLAVRLAQGSSIRGVRQLVVRQTMATS
jgi:hypothetical protein